MGGVDWHLEKLLRLRGELTSANLIPFHAYFSGRDEFQNTLRQCRGLGYGACTASEMCGRRYY